MEHWTRGHVHRIAGISTTDRDHSHGYSIYTGPPIHMCGGLHVHQFDGMTTVNQDHDHGVQLETGTPEPCTCQGPMSEYEMQYAGETYW